MSLRRAPPGAKFSKISRKRTNKTNKISFNQLENILQLHSKRPVTQQKFFKNFIIVKRVLEHRFDSRIFFMHRRKMIKKPFNQLFNNNSYILQKLNINLNLRPQNLNFETYYKLTEEYEKL